MEKEKTVDAIDVANYVIKYLKKRGKSVNHLKLQKLLYYIEAWHLVFFDSPIFSEDIKAWQHGPVLESVWHHFKRYSILYNELEACEECESDLSDEQKDLINDVLDEYGDKTGYYLENLTHEEKPWQKAWASANKTLDKELMKTYYGARLDAKKQKAKTSVATR